MTSRLLSVPHELMSEIVAHLASSPLPPKRQLKSRSQSHWDAYSHHKLAPTPIKDLQSLSLTHTHLLPFCRAQLFRTMRVYPGMPATRVEALLDLFHRAPELSRHVKELWWTIGVEEYRGRYEWFRWGSEEREVRRAEERLALVTMMAKGSGRGGLKKVWVTGCESQRTYDAAQRQRRVAAELSGGIVGYHSSGLAVDAQAEMGFGEVMETLQCVVASPALRCLSFVNVAFPGEVLRRCVNLGELTLGEDVKVIAQTMRGDLQDDSWEDADDELEGVLNYLPPKLAVRPHLLSLPCKATGKNAQASTNMLFEPQWVDFEDEEYEKVDVRERGRCITSDPVLDLTNLLTLSCQYPSPEFAATMRNLNETGGGRDLKEISLQVTDFGALVDDMGKGTFSVPDGRPLDRLSLTCNLPSSATLRTPSVIGVGVNQHLPSALAAPTPPTLPECVSQLLTSLASTFGGTRTVDVEFSASVEHGVAILSDRASGGLDLVPLARKLSNSFSAPASSAECLLQSINVHFSLVPGCYSSYAYGSNESDDSEGVMSKERVAERHSEATGILQGVGVQLKVEYDVVV